MKQPKSQILNIALYAYRQKNITEFTATQLFDFGIAAHEHYNRQIPVHVLADKLRILEQHGFTEEIWQQILVQSGSFYFSPDEKTQLVNKKLKKLLRNVPLVNSPPYQMNYCSALIHDAIENNYFQYVQNDKRPYVYRINPELLNETEN